MSSRVDVEMRPCLVTPLAVLILSFSCLPSVFLVFSFKSSGMGKKNTCIVRLVRSKFLFQKHNDSSSGIYITPLLLISTPTYVLNEEIASAWPYRGISKRQLLLEI